MKQCPIPENLYLQQRHYANLKHNVHLPTLLLQILHCRVAHFHDMCVPTISVTYTATEICHSTIYFIHCICMCVCAYTYN
jgi:hypothetical protein